MPKNKITQAVILSAGLGTRLRPLTDNIPKVMLPLGGKPLLRWHIENLKEYGIKEFFINLHYLPEKIINYFGDGAKFGVKIDYVLEKPEILGTAGGIKNFEKSLGDSFLVLYGDLFYKIHYDRLVDFYGSHGDAIGIGTARQTDHPWDSDLAVIGDGDRVVEFLIRPHKELPKSYWGISAPFIFSKKILDYIPAGKYYEIDRDLVPDILRHGYSYYAYRLHEDEFRKDIGTMERYNEVQEYISRQGRGSPLVPRVSILMATWNRASMISRTIESVLAQSFKDWELIIADDGSTDKTPEVVEMWKKRALPAGRQARIVYVRSEVNQGISKNYNQGLRIARGEYVAMIDDDDPWCDREKLKKQVDFLDKNPDYVGCGAGVVVVNIAGKELYRYLKSQGDAEIRNRMLFGNPMANSTTLWRRAVGEKVGWYDESTRYSGDRDFWLKMGLRGKLCNFPEYFSYYTMSRDNTSIIRMRPHLKASLMVMKRYRKNYPHYPSALIFNWVQYLYSFLPAAVKRLLHYSLARLKRLVVG